jgi:hypothetical protein
VLRNWWRLAHGWWLLMVAATLGTVVSLLASSLPGLAGAVLVAVGSGIAGILAVRAERAIERRDAKEGPRELRSGMWRVRGLDDPLAIGVHPALAMVTDAGTVDKCPPFVRRDVSGELEGALRTGGFVLVVGESTAGKTRAAYEAMRVCLPEHVFVRPRSRDELAGALREAARHRRSVLWLDDLELYLGPGGLSAEMLSSLLAVPKRDAVVVATMRSHERARYSPRLAQAAEADERHALRMAGEVLNLAREVRIERMWTSGERQRAAEDVDDRRIVKALEKADRFGVAQYLAAGPELFREWQDAWGSWPEGRPRGAALVTAAVDVRRAGFHQPLPIGFLREMHEAYLDEEGRSYLRLESWQAALGWATEPLHATSSLLMPAGDGHYAAFDYLADAADDNPSVPNVPGHAWQAVVDFVPPPDLMEVAWSAYLRGRPDISEKAVTRALANGHYDAALEYAEIMRDTTRAQDVVARLEKAVELATEAGAPPEKILDLRTEIAFWLGARYRGGGDPRAAHDLAMEVIADSTRLLGADHPRTLGARLTLIRQIGDMGRGEEALAMAREVAETVERVHGPGHWMHGAAMFEVAAWLHESGDAHGAVRLWLDLVEARLSGSPRRFEDPLRNVTYILTHDADPALVVEAAGRLEALVDRARRAGADRRAVILMTSTLAVWVGRQGDDIRAQRIARQALKESETAFGPLDLRTIEAKIVLAGQEGGLGNFARARELAESAAADADRVYGECHYIAGWAREERERWAGDPP